MSNPRAQSGKTRLFFLGPSIFLSIRLRKSYIFSFPQNSWRLGLLMQPTDLQSVRKSFSGITMPQKRSISWYFSGQTDSAGAIRKIGINTTPFTVGRISEASLQLDSKSISKQHAELIIQGDELWLRDLNSTNGTFVNGERIAALTRLQPGDLMQFATSVFRIGREERQTVGHTASEQDISDQALAMMQFDRLIHDGGVVPFYQPIVELPGQKVVAYEVLGRSRLFGLTTPAEMFAAAQQLNQVNQLSMTFRSLGVEIAFKHGLLTNLFLNTHPDELGTDALIQSLEILRRSFSAQQITLEIHEAAVTNCSMINQLRDTLREMSIFLAFDDFGEGQARLVELSEVRPDYLKFDMGLTRNIHAASQERQKVVSMIARMVNELGIISLAEGVESEQDHEVLCEMGFKLAQGYYYGHPAPISKLLPKDADA